MRRAASSSTPASADLSAALGGNFVNRFNVEGRSYKVIPQLERSARLTPEQLETIRITGPGGQTIPLSAVASLKDSVEPRTLSRFQQLNAVKLSTMATQSLEGALQALDGIAKKILIVEFANVQQERGLSKIEAVKEASKTRLRPILMTTLATVAGHFPLTLVSGPGAVARNSIGGVLVGGMTIGTLFTLFVLPSLYVLLAKDHRGEHLRVQKLAPFGSRHRRSPNKRRIEVRFI